MKIPPKDMKTGFIRYSTDIDLEEILLWLEDQDRASVDGTFHCNKNLTIESHNEGELLVYIDSVNYARDIGSASRQAQTRDR